MLAPPSQHSQIVVHEETPLLDHNGDRAQQPLKAQEPARRSPLPKVQMLVLCFMRLAEPVSFTVIFPMVSFMIQDFESNIPASHVGFYAGVIESTFALAQCVTVLFWGRLSDRWGRKPVMLLGLFGVMVSTIAFGAAKSFAGMVIARVVGGMLNGNVAVIKCIVGEITDATNQGLAFSLLPLTFAIGSVIGPMLGGFLPHPAERFHFPPFQGSQFWAEWPWLLPCLVAAIFPMVAAIFGVLFLKETLPSKVKQSSTTIESVVDELVDERPATFESLLGDSNIRVILESYTLLAFQTIALEVLISLFAFTPIESGASSSKCPIGLALSFAGASTIILQLFLFPPLQRRMGTVSLYRACMLAYPFIFCGFPLLSVVAGKEAAAGPSRRITWTLLLFILFIKTAANMAYSCSMILVNAAAPTRSSLGTLNGLAQTGASLVRAIGPISATSLFALSVSKHIAGGFLVWWLLLAVALVGVWLSTKLREGAPLLRREDVEEVRP